MNDMVPFLILFIYLVVGLILFALLIYFIIKRIDEKANEDFEKRNN